MNIFFITIYIFIWYLQTFKDISYHSEGLKISPQEER